MSDKDLKGLLKDDDGDVDFAIRAELTLENLALREQVAYLSLVSSANVALGFCAGVAFMGNPQSDNYKRAAELLAARAKTWGDQCNELAAMLLESEPDMGAEYARVREAMHGYAAR